MLHHLGRNYSTIADSGRRCFHALRQRSTQSDGMCNLELNNKMNCWIDSWSLFLGSLEPLRLENQPHWKHSGKECLIRRTSFSRCGNCSPPYCVGNRPNSIIQFPNCVRGQRCALVQGHGQRLPSWNLGRCDSNQ